MWSSFAVLGSPATAQLVDVVADQAHQKTISIFLVGLTYKIRGSIKMHCKKIWNTRGNIYRSWRRRLSHLSSVIGSSTPQIIFLESSKSLNAFSSIDRLQVGLFWESLSHLENIGREALYMGLLDGRLHKGTIREPHGDELDSKSSDCHPCPHFSSIIETSARLD